MTHSTPADQRYRDVHDRMARGDRQGALAVVETWLHDDPGDARAHFLRGRIDLDRGLPQQALESLVRAVEIDPGTAWFHAFLGYCRLKLGQNAEALRCAETAAALPADDRTLDLIATIQSHLNRHRDAATTLQRAVAKGTQIPTIFFNLAVNLKFCGDFDEAKVALERAIALDPEHVKARAMLSELRPATRERNQIADYEALLQRARDPAQRLHLCHAASRECDALRDYDRSFAFLETGKAGMRAAIDYDFAEDKALFDAMRAFGGAKPAGGCGDERPIFVVGMPRSGTTVVDRILSGHPVVASVGETLHISALLQELAGRRSPQLLDPRDVAPLLAHDDLSALGRAYLDRLPQPLPDRVVDKFHLNSLLAGFILRALPNARIVCVVRGAMDTIVGNYRRLLDYRSAVYRYALSIETIARYYVEFRKLADFWAALFPDRFRIVSYEQLIADPDGVTREMLAFCGLDWRPGVTQIENNAAPVATASAVQVREPLNARSIGTWRRYQRHLEPAQRIVRDAGLDL